jgi:MSHA biogenesis protein MshJ
MKERVSALRAKLDAMSVRERVMVFGAAVALVTFVLHSLLLGPLLKRQGELRAQIEQQQASMSAIDAEITAQVRGYVIDPDQDSRAHLVALQADAEALRQNLRAMQSGLIEPERVAPLIETMLKANGRLQLVALKTLPMTVLNAAAPGAAAPAGVAPAPAPAPTQPGDLKAIQPGLAALVNPPAPAAALPAAAATPAAKPQALLYRHGVQVTVRGNYLDMVDYLGTLEAMPSRLFWGSAELKVEQYPDARLTLTVYTLSLDEKWMKL